MIEDPDTDLHVPALCDVEVSAALRRALLAGAIDERQALDALDDYLDLPLTTHGHRALLHRVIALRHNLSAYDATYVALAEAMQATLLSADRPLLLAVQQHALVNLATEGNP